MLSYSSLAEVKAGLFHFGVQILMCMVSRAGPHLTLLCYTGLMHRNTESSAPHALQSPGHSLCSHPCCQESRHCAGRLHPAFLHYRELGKVGLETMPFLSGGDHVLLRHWELSRVWAKPEPRAANSESQGSPFKLRLSEQGSAFHIHISPLNVFRSGF